MSQQLILFKQINFLYFFVMLDNQGNDSASVYYILDTAFLYYFSVVLV
jgi:hypothetical protein